ncbi:uncharacterized protein LOC122370367 [Amphibalanus amphitrite]|uniref:uncharacterized protein LOC122370367 n=1 Tax=Amphibalanus amphitrite TaxID=1232801 RepID=UPI001C90174D|nr:uncharacterized protein LOC122370367 [Amphibalanus amphitrite]
MKENGGNEDVILRPTIEWISNKPDSINHEYVEYGLREAVRSVFGEFGACSPLSVTSYDVSAGRAIVSVPADFARRVAAALTLATDLLGSPCVIHVHGESPHQPTARRYFA